MENDIQYQYTLQVWVRDNIILDCNHQDCHEDWDICNQHKYEGKTIEEALLINTKRT